MTCFYLGIQDFLSHFRVTAAPYVLYVILSNYDVGREMKELHIYRTGRMWGNRI